MRLLDQPPMRRLDRSEVRVALQFQRIERAHLVPGTAAVAGTRPLPLRRLAEALGAEFLVGFALRSFFRGQAGEVIPVLVVLGGVSFAEIPALRAVRSLGRRTVADLPAAFSIAQAHPGRVPPLVAVGAPAGKAPIVRPLLLRHQRSR